MKNATFGAALFLSAIAVCGGIVLWNSNAVPAAPSTPEPPPLLEYLGKAEAGYAGIRRYRDRETGCEYFYSSSNSGLRPRIDSDGNHYCTGTKL